MQKGGEEFVPNPHPETLGDGDQDRRPGLLAEG